MATTHALVGAAVGVLVAGFAPEVAVTAAVAGFAGGLFPDLDLYAGHRKTLHFPTYYSLAAAAAATVAVLAPGVATLALAVFLAAAALHSVMDVFGGGLELRPWEGTSERAVYDHASGRWLSPRRWVRYDGAPEDFALGCLAAVAVLAAGTGRFDAVIVAAVGVSGVYAAVRKRLPALACALLSLVPPRLVARVPDRFVEDLV